ncbi:hypothetical protein D3C85_715990 [compost metagenome]
MGLGDEVELAADAAEHAAILQLVGDTGTEQGDGEATVDEAGIAPLQALECLVAMEAVDEADGGHRDASALFLAQRTQALVEGQRPQEEAAVHQHARLGPAPVRLQGRVTDVAGDAVAVRQPQPSFLEANALVQQAPALQPGQALRIQAPRQQLGQGVEAGDGAIAIQHPGIHQALQLDIVIHCAPHDSRLQQHQQAEHEHLAVGVEPVGEGHQAAFPVDQPTPALRHAHGLQQCPVACVVGLAGEQCGGQGIGHGAYAHLQGAAVANQGAGVQAYGVVLQADRHVRGRKQAAALHLLQDQVEGVGLHL